MKRFLTNVFIFSCLGLLIFILGLFLPATPKASNYYLFSKIEKDSLLSLTKEPRIIFIGGSNLVYGLNSELIRDSLDLNPINAGLTATVGLRYMMDNILEHIRTGDIVVIAPEYQQFNGKFAYGGQDLVRVVLDVDPDSYKFLTKKQWVNFIRKTPEFFVSKLKPNEYFNYKLKPAYTRDIFNEFGDSDMHWALKKQNFDSSDFTRRKLNRSIFKEIKEFEAKLKRKGALMFITFPGFAARSYDLNEKQIIEVEEELIRYEFSLLGNSRRYRIPDDLMFDTPYHMTEKGVLLRTHLLIEDLKPKLESN